MLRRAFSIFFLFFPCFIPGYEDVFSKIDYYYNYSHLDSSYLEKGVNLCSEILKEQPDDAQVLWRIARLKLALAEGRPTSEQKLKCYEEALSYADKAKRKDPGSADAHYVYAVILGRTAQTRGFVDFIVQIKNIKDEFELALKINPNHCGALHGLGIWFAEASNFYPAWSSQAHEYLGKALRADPNNSMVYITLARLCIREKKYTDARKFLSVCLELKTPTIPSEFYNYSKPQALILIEEIKGK